jgi:ADP-heptose:LPS heptosyltransferase/SAM-dependent methyltransferase
MPTADRRRFVPAAVRCFQSQDYANTELVVLDNGRDAIDDLLPNDPRIRYERHSSARTLGAWRNAACQLARGEIVAHWDDDDWYPADRISRQVATLLQREVDICGSSRFYCYEVEGVRAWEYCYSGSPYPWLAGSTLAYKKSCWQRNPFPDLQAGEDARFVWAHAKERVIDLADPELCIATLHGGNTSPKRLDGPCWVPIDRAQVAAMLARARLPSDRVSRNARPARISRDVDSRKGRTPALVIATSGIGDIVRITPLIRVLHDLGHVVDVFLAPDYPETAQLLAGAPEIRRLICVPDARDGRSLPDEEYALACATYWATDLLPSVRSRQKLSADREEWLARGDGGCIERMARALGWRRELPAPFVVTSKRDFALPSGTVVLHPGCKRGWPWKKWHGFAELAGCFRHVVVVGSEEDLHVADTYFGGRFDWPEHVTDYTGQLSLSDTAALIAQSAALIGNDSGLMHIGAAVGTPTFPIFGITSPQREMSRLPHVHPISKGLDCEPACRAAPWGRTDCDRHLECLKLLSADEVVQRVVDAVVVVPLRAPANREEPRRHSSPAANIERVCIGAQLVGGVGDVLLASCYLQALYDEFHDCTVEVFYHQPEVARAILGNARFVQTVHAAETFPQRADAYDLTVSVLQFVRYQVRDPEKIARANPGFAERLRAAQHRFESYSGLAAEQPFLDGLWARISVQAGRTVLDNLGYLGGVAVDRDTQLFLALEPAAEDPLFGHIGDAPYVTVHDGFDNTTPVAAGLATKCWPLEHWADLVRRLKSQMPGVRIVQLGAAKSRAIAGVDVDLVDRTSLQQAAWIVKNALLHIDTDSGLVHVARAVHTPAVALFGPTDVAYYGYRQHSNVKAAVCGNCWWSTPDWLGRCPRGLAQPECMRSIPSAEVARRACDLLAGASSRRGAATCGELRLYDGELWRARRSDLIDVCGRLGLPLLPISAHSRNPETGVYIHASKQWEYLFALECLATRHGERASGLRVADVGGGRGALAPYLAALGNSVTVVDTDYLWDDGGDPDVERRYRAWARRFGYEARFGSLYNLPADDEAFDVVTSISVVEHVAHKDFVLKEALRVLKPGGLLILTFDFSNQPERFEDGIRREIFSPDRLVAALEEIGVLPPHSDPRAVEASARAIQEDGVLGIPAGVTVAGLMLTKLQTTRRSAV